MSQKRKTLLPRDGAGSFSVPPGTGVIKRIFLKQIEPKTKRFAELRNGLEHPTEQDFTRIEDFQLTPKGIAPPCWQRGGVANEGPILDEMEFFVRFVVELSETVFFFGLLDNIAPNFQIGFQVEQVAEAEIDPECPIRYALLPRLAQGLCRR